MELTAAAEVNRAKEIIGESYERLGVMIGTTGGTVRNWALGRPISRLAQPAYRRLIAIAARREAQAAASTANEVGGDPGMNRILPEPAGKLHGGPELNPTEGEP